MQKRFSVRNSCIVEQDIFAGCRHHLAAIAL
jgi:hypothetical protein